MGPSDCRRDIFRPVFCEDSSTGEVFLKGSFLGQDERLACLECLVGSTNPAIVMFCQIHQYLRREEMPIEIRLRHKSEKFQVGKTLGAIPVFLLLPETKKRNPSGSRISAPLNTSRKGPSMSKEQIKKPYPQSPQSVHDIERVREEGPGTRKPSLRHCARVLHGLHW